jgi:formylglycine-generating enzyme required for sulfatase activity
MSKNWAICIGIKDYYNLTPLEFAVQDALAVKDFLLKEVGCEEEEVLYFSDDSPPIKTSRGPMKSQPTYANLKRFFRDRFQTPFLSAGDTCWVFFAGHGELHEGHDYLMPIDVDPGNLNETALKISDITASLRNSGADNTVLLLDACRSQGRRSAMGFGSEAQPGMVRIYSCSPGQSSYEVEELQHGLFTYALLEGFRLQGANSCATVQRIDQYLRHQVPSLSQRYKKPIQTPCTAVEPISKNCLILLPQRARLEDVQALKNEAYKAETQNEWDFAQQLWTRVLATPGVDQDAIAAIARIALNRVQHPPAAGNSSPATAGSRRIKEQVTKPVTQSPPPVQPGYKVERLVQPVEPPGPVVPKFEFDVVTISSIEKGGLFGLGAPQVKTRSRRATAEYRREDLGSGVSLDLVMIPGGNFQMGSPAGQGGDSVRHQHEVSVKPFLMGRYPVTQAQWRGVAALPKIARDLDADPSNFKGNNRPVEQVDWDDATEFCQRLSKHTNRAYRLPSEAEWEYACRAGTTTAFHFGETLNSDLANYNATYAYGSGPKGQYRKETTNIGSFPANAFGLYDMHGNVWEWCQDHWYDNYVGAPIDGSAWLSSAADAKRLLRGGSWFYSPSYCRSATRHVSACDLWFNGIGFRVVCASSWTLV